MFFKENVGFEGKANIVVIYRQVAFEITMLSSKSVNNIINIK